MAFHYWLDDWYNEKEDPPPWINNANFMLLSKSGIPNPKVEDTRPIAMMNALKKMTEATFMRIYGKYLWATIHPS